jgi:hypothetical protein
MIFKWYFLVFNYIFWIKLYLNYIFWFKWYLNEIKSLSLRVIPLQWSHPFLPWMEKIKLEWNIHEQNRIFFYLCSIQFNRAERAKISILPMPDWYATCTDWYDSSRVFLIHKFISICRVSSDTVDYQLLSQRARTIAINNPCSLPLYDTSNLEKCLGAGWQNGFP